MTVEIKYYKIVDPVTGAVTKDVGYVAEREVRDYMAKTVDGKLVVIKDNKFNKVTTHEPASEHKEQITKEEFDALEIAGENVIDAAFRERRVRALEVKANKAKSSEVVDAKDPVKEVSNKTAPYAKTEVLIPVESTPVEDDKSHKKDK